MELDGLAQPAAHLEALAFTPTHTTLSVFRGPLYVLRFDSLLNAEWHADSSKVFKHDQYHN